MDSHAGSEAESYLCPLCDEERKNDGSEVRHKDREIVEILEELEEIGDSDRVEYKGQDVLSDSIRVLRSNNEGEFW